VLADNTVEITARNVVRIRLLLREELFPSPGLFRTVINNKEVFRGGLSKDGTGLHESAQSAEDRFLAYSGVYEFDLRK